MAERCRPVQTSAVYILGRRQTPAIPPPSPPSPATPGNEAGLCTPIEELVLDGDDNDNDNNDGDDKESESELELANSLMASEIGDGALPTAVVGGTTSRESPMLDDRLTNAVHVLATEAAAVQSVAQLYATSRSARAGFDEAVEAIVRTQTAQPPGKLVVVGVGKSGHIGRKLAATFNSLAVPASFLHPTEALHGDLGHIRAHDALLFITYSGKTHELLTLLPHVDPALPLILLTAHVTAETCELVRHRPGVVDGDGTTGPTILLPAPIPQEEKISFGVAAPTSSTTTALAVGDALAIVASKELHPAVNSVFRRNHPGGAIGEAFRCKPAAAAPASATALSAAGSDSVPPSPPSSSTTLDGVRYLSVPWADIPVVRSSSTAPVNCAEVLRAGYSSTNGWVRIESDRDVDVSGDNSPNGVASPSRIRALRSVDLAQPVQAVPGLVVGRADFVVVAADTKVRSAAEWLRAAPEGSDDEAIVAVMDKGQIVGVMELKELFALTQGGQRSRQKE